MIKLFVLVFSVYFTNISYAEGGIIKVSTESQKKSYLFTIEASKAKLVNKFLSIRKSNISQIVMFTDRPLRTVKRITLKDFWELWYLGSDSFKKNPPNASLSGNEVVSRIVVLEDMIEKNGHVLFKLSSTEGLPKGEFEGLVITIDNLSITTDSIQKYKEGNMKGFIQLIRPQVRLKY